MLRSAGRIVSGGEQIVDAGAAGSGMSVNNGGLEYIVSGGIAGANPIGGTLEVTSGARRLWRYHDHRCAGVEFFGSDTAGRAPVIKYFATNIVMQLLRRHYGTQLRWRVRGILAGFGRSVESRYPTLKPTQLPVLRFRSSCSINESQQNTLWRFCNVRVSSLDITFSMYEVPNGNIVGYSIVTLQVTSVNPSASDATKSKRPV